VLQPTPIQEVPSKTVTQPPEPLSKPSAMSETAVPKPGATSAGADAAAASITVLPTERYTSVRVCIEAAINLQYTASHSQVEEEFWAGAETSKTQTQHQTQTETQKQTQARAQTQSSAPKALLRNIPQGLFVSYRWQETEEVVCSPLVGPSSNPKWFHSRHLPLARPSKTSGDRILVLKLWKRLKGLEGLGDVASLPLQLGAHARAQETVQDPDLDRLIGCAAIDLSPLFLGMEELCGWYTVHDLRQRSLGQLKVVVAPVDAVLSSYRYKESSSYRYAEVTAGGGEVRLGSPPQRGPPGFARGDEPCKRGAVQEGASESEGGSGERWVSEEAGLRGQGSEQQGLEGRSSEEASLEGQGLWGRGLEESGLGGRGLEDGLKEGLDEGLEEGLEGQGLGRQSSMEDVHLRLEELQELSRKMLERRGLPEGGRGVSQCGDVIAEASQRDDVLAEGPQRGDVSAEGSERGHAIAEGWQSAGRDSCREESSYLSAHMSAGGVSHFGGTAGVVAEGEGFAKGGGLQEGSAHFAAHLSVGTATLQEDEDIVKQGEDELNTGEGETSWAAETSTYNGGLEFDGEGDGNDGWASVKEEYARSELVTGSRGVGYDGQAPGVREKESAAGSEFGIAVGGAVQPPRETVNVQVDLQDLKGVTGSEGEAATEYPEEGKKLERARTDERVVSGSLLRTREDRVEAGEGSTGQGQTSTQLAPITGTGNLPPLNQEGGAKCNPVTAIPGVEIKSPPKSFMTEERRGHSDRLPPRAPKAPGSSKGYPFTLHSSITFVPSPHAPSRAPRPSPLPLTVSPNPDQVGVTAISPSRKDAIVEDRSFMEGRWSVESRVAAPQYGLERSFRRTSREEEVEGFRGFSRRVEAIVTAAAAAGPTWAPPSEISNLQVSPTPGVAESSTRLFARLDAMMNLGEESQRKANRRKYADKETERIARIMGMESM
jgi:hypothetical protein